MHVQRVEQVCSKPGNEVEHFEIGSYESLKTLAELLGHSEIIPLLDQTLQEERKPIGGSPRYPKADVNRKAAQSRSQFTR
jgi:ferritin-like metal-binding protein YciE